MQTLIKNSLFIFTNIVIGSATIYSLIAPEAGNRTVNSFIFPEQVPLNAWNQIKSNSLSVKPKITLELGKESIASVKHYQYSQDDLSIDAKIFYVVDTRGNVNQLIETYTNIAQDVIKQQEIKKYNDIGFYSLFHDRDRAYLSTCLKAQGNTIVTAQQFSASLNQVKITPSLLGNWLLGKASIRDRRCLWIHLSIPLQSEINSTYSILENTWIDLVQWWIPNFPPL
ncbi:MAG: cyanoexosortase A system-associated protein [Xenococcaceae cyanobacterium MO_207.B15]|nr:cyanoexosortase A system-associated protein [Xenococcaceae cyanobacterium MO_207.B15]